MKKGNPYLHDCSACETKCDGVSKGVYDFQSDVAFSEHFEQELVKKIKRNDHFAKKTEKDGYPDIEVYDREGGELLCYIEVKAQRRTFMSVKDRLPKAGLAASETMALNLSDLLRYFKIDKEVDVPVYIMWLLEDRPCVLGDKAVLSFYQDVRVLERIYKKAGDARRFRRMSGKGDVVDGVHKGVVVNYHFSLNEMEPFQVKDFLKKLSEEG